MDIVLQQGIIYGWTLGRGPNHENEKIITAVCFFTVIIHIKDLENVCNTQKSDLAMGLFC